jgi:hypothetical protein
MILQTVCQHGHVEFVEAKRFAESGRLCFRRFPDGVFCDAKIINAFGSIEEADNVRPGPDDSVAPGVLLDRGALVQQIEGVARILLDRGIVLTEEQANLVQQAMESAGEALPRVQDLIRTADPVDELLDDEEFVDDDLLDEDLDARPWHEPILQRVQRALQPLAFLLPYRPLIVSAAILSAGLTFYLYATGHWILALLV